jgi:hypothetical protein
MLLDEVQYEIDIVLIEPFKPLDLTGQEELA